MSETLEEVKRRLRDEFLGRGGIHGFGLSRANQQIKVYIHTPPAEEGAILNDVRTAAQPFSVTVVHEEQPHVN